MSKKTKQKITIKLSDEHIRAAAAHIAENHATESKALTGFAKPVLENIAKGRFTPQRTQADGITRGAITLNLLG